MTTLIIAADLADGRAHFETRDAVIITPSLIHMAAGREFDDVVFTLAAEQIPRSAANLIADWVIPCFATDPDRDVLEKQVRAWLMRVPDDPDRDAPTAPPADPVDLFAVLESAAPAVSALTGMKKQLVDAGWTPEHAEAVVIEMMRASTKGQS